MPETLEWSSLQPLNPTILAEIPETPGAYRLSYKSGDGSYYVFFVGSADTSLRERLLGHTSGSEGNSCTKTHIQNLECFFRYAVVDKKSLLPGIEKALYHNYTPKCNLEEPGGEPVEVNFD